MHAVAHHSWHHKCHIIINGTACPSDLPQTQGMHDVHHLAFVLHDVWDSKDMHLPNMLEKVVP